MLHLNKTIPCSSAAEPTTVNRLVVGSNPTGGVKKLKPDVTARIFGSILVVSAYFVVLHINITLGVIMHFIADMISIPYFVRTKSWDVVIMLVFLLCISFSKLLS